MTRLAPLLILALAGCAAQPVALPPQPVLPTVVAIPPEIQARVAEECDAIKGAIELMGPDLDALAGEISEREAARATADALAERGHELSVDLSGRLVCGVMLPLFSDMRRETRCLADARQCPAERLEAKE